MIMKWRRSGLAHVRDYECVVEAFAAVVEPVDGEATSSV
jgi:hypothetical protein